MSVLSDGTDPSDVSPAGKVYQAMVGTLLAAEYDRRTKMEARGSTLVTTSSTLLTIIFGLTVVVTGKDYVFSNGIAVVLLIAALIAFVVSAILGIVVQTQPIPYSTVGRVTLKQLTTDDTLWRLPVDEAVREDVAQQVLTVGTLRAGTLRIANRVTAGLKAQAVAIVLLTASVSIELLGRTGILTNLTEWFGDTPLFWWWPGVGLD